jgi:hypothetical protein
VEKRTLIYVAAALNIAVAGAACSSARGNEGDKDARGAGSGDAVTVEGCLTAGQDGRFALTAAPGAAVATTARAVDDERDTHSYVLVGGDNLQAHLGKRVEVVGTVAGKAQDLEQKTTSKTEAPPTSGTTDTPTVKTKEEIDLEVRQLHVRQVRDVAPTCEVK